MYGMLNVLWEMQQYTGSSRAGKPAKPDERLHDAGPVGCA
jgi:hypothetical protein